MSMSKKTRSASVNELALGLELEKKKLISIQPSWWNHPYLKVGLSPLKGRYVYTTQDIKCREGILLEIPAARGRDAVDNVQNIIDAHCLYPANQSTTKKGISAKMAQNILDFNQFAIGRNGNQVGLYLHTSMFNHSCKPNVSFQILGRKCTMSLNALRDIQKDEELCISYCGLHPLVDNKAARRDELKTWFDKCACVMCSMPDRQSTSEKMEEIISPLMDNINIIERECRLDGPCV
jgi:hypothetical protein